MDYTFNKELFKAAKKKIKGLTNEKIAQILTERGHPITVDGITHWFRSEDNKPEIEKIEILAEILNEPFNKLAIIKDEIRDKIIGEYSSVKFVPVVGEASCGLPISSSFQEIGRKTPYSGDFWHEDLYSVVACGDSMAPDIEDGDEVVCDPRADVLSGDMVHYKFLGEEAIKIFYDNKDLDAIELIPYNQSPEFKTVSIRRDDENINFIDMAKVVSINKLRINNRSARLRLVGKL